MDAGTSVRRAGRRVKQASETPCLAQTRLQRRCRGAADGGVKEPRTEGGGGGRSGECEVLWEEEQSPALSPRERPCSGPRGTRSQRLKRMNGRMEGRCWLAPAPRPAPGPQTGPGPGPGPAIVLQQSRRLSPRERAAPGPQGSRSPLDGRTDARTHEWRVCRLSDKEKEGWR